MMKRTYQNTNLDNGSGTPSEEGSEAEHTFRIVGWRLPSSTYRCQLRGCRNYRQMIPTLSWSLCRSDKISQSKGQRNGNAGGLTREPWRDGLSREPLRNETANGFATEERRKGVKVWECDLHSHAKCYETSMFNIGFGCKTILRLDWCYYQPTQDGGNGQKWV